MPLEAHIGRVGRAVEDTVRQGLNREAVQRHDGAGARYGTAVVLMDDVEHVDGREGMRCVRSRVRCDLEEGRRHDQIRARLPNACAPKAGTMEYKINRTI